MRTPILVTGFFLLVLSVAFASEEKSKNDRDPWNDFGIGSWVIEEESETRGDKTETRREKLSRIEAKIFKSGIELKQTKEGSKRGVFDGMESSFCILAGYDPAVEPSAKQVDTSQEVLTIQGKKYACEVKKYQIDNREGKTTVTYWHCQGIKVPYREMPGPPRSTAMRPDVLRLDVDYLGKNESVYASMRVVNFQEDRKIGDKKVICIKEEGEVESSSAGKKGKGTITRLLSHEVPGHEVESLTEAKIDGEKFRLFKRIETFEVVKK